MVEKEIAKLALQDENFKEKFIPAFLESYYSTNKNIVTVNQDNKIIGFAHWCMITDNTLDKLKDLKFDNDRLYDLKEQGDNCFVITVVIDKSYRSNGVINKLRRKIEKVEPEAKVLSWLTPNMDKLVINKIKR